MSIDPRVSAQVEGRAAAEANRPSSANPYAWSQNYELHLAWFNAWHVRRVELEDSVKLQQGEGEVEL